MSDATLHRRRWRLSLTWLGTLIVLGVLLRMLGGDGVAKAARGARLGWVAVAFAGSCGCVVLGVVRWRLVLAAMGWRLGFGRALEVVLATWPPAVLTPSRANELLRAVAVRDVVPLAAGTGSILAEKAIDLFVLLVLSAAGMVARALWRWSLVIAAILVAEVGAIAVVAARRRWLERLPLLRRPGTVEGLFRAFDALRRAPMRLLGIGAVSLSIRLATVGVIQALLAAVGAGVRPFETVTLWPAATLVGAAPITLGGMGTRDAAFIYLLRTQGLHAEPSGLFAATLAYSAVAVWSFALIGLPLMIREAARH